MLADSLVKIRVAKHFGNRDRHDIQEFVEAFFIMEQSIQQFAKTCEPRLHQRPFQTTLERGTRIMRKIVAVATTDTVQQHVDFQFFTNDSTHQDSTMVSVEGRLIPPPPVGTTRHAAR